MIVCYLKVEADIIQKKVLTTLFNVIKSRNILEALDVDNFIGLRVTM